MTLLPWVARWTAKGSFPVVISLWAIANVALPVHFWLLKFNTLKSKGDVPFNEGPDPTTLQSKVLFKCFCVMLKVSCLLSYAMTALTMCRWTWTRVSMTKLRKFLPLDRFESIHKWSAIIGWFELCTVTLVYLINWKYLCDYYKAGNESWNFCADFYSEVMITGYLLTFFHTVIIITSLRAVRQKKYELFYWTHHLCVAIFVLSIVHPMDWRHRRGAKERLQTWPVMIGPVSLYLLDRLIIMCSHRWTTCMTCTLLSEPKTVFLRLHGPKGFLWQRPGMITWLNCPPVSWHNWHPFSCAHSDETGSLFLIIHCREGGWTEQLYNCLAMATPQISFSRSRGIDHLTFMRSQLPSKIIDGRDSKLLSENPDVQIIGRPQGFRSELAHGSAPPHSGFFESPLRDTANYILNSFSNGRDGTVRVAVDRRQRRRHGSSPEAGLLSPVAGSLSPADLDVDVQDGKAFRSTDLRSYGSREPPCFSDGEHILMSPRSSNRGRSEAAFVSVPLTDNHTGPGYIMLSGAESAATSGSDIKPLPLVVDRGIQTGCHSNTSKDLLYMPTEATPIIQTTLLPMPDERGVQTDAARRLTVTPRSIGIQTDTFKEELRLLPSSPRSGSASNISEFFQETPMPDPKKKPDKGGSTGVLTRDSISSPTTPPPQLRPTHSCAVEKTISGEDIGRGLFMVRDFWSVYKQTGRYGRSYIPQSVVGNETCWPLGSNEERKMWLENLDLIPRLVKWGGSFGLSGPFHAGTTEASAFEHAIMVGAGGGIVPCLAHVKSFVDFRCPESKAPRTRKSVARLFDTLSITRPRIESARKSYVTEESGIRYTVPEKLAAIIDNSPYWAFLWYWYILLEFLTSVGALALSVNGSMRTERMGNTLWPLFKTLHWIMAMLFFFHKVTVHVAFGLVPRKIRLDGSGETRGSRMSLFQQIFDWILIVLSFCFLVINQVGRIVWNEDLPQLPQTTYGYQLPGGLMSGLTWDYFCHITRVGGYFCKLKQVYSEELLLAEVCFVGIFLCSILRMLRVWAQTPRLLSGGQSTGQVARWEKELGRPTASCLLTVDLVWIMRSPGWLMKMRDELEGYLKRSADHNGPLRLDVYLTGNEITQQIVDDLFEGSRLHPCIKIGRPNLSAVFGDICEQHMAGIAKGERMGIFVAGPYAVQTAAKNACDEVRQYVLDCVGSSGGTITWLPEKFS
eukprot:Gregarina_sp_Poly_1__1555@NODE_1394_length_4224_cov_86_295165_g179_i1_p1_GENE_NODE_1394_length_4224_cov_86_295165_g179_i1NODE_1394_length_4224_cov_86_295165_g179_i1_p1_ORF_typecomplete_len1190_score120_32Ferric_reduct/PF01794_19/1_8e14Ferric_reduct/PF01794_19/2_5e03Ferric_reduct/PF01794_19/3_4e02FAD_binding_8/PF08022_12/1_9e10FAD_binding_8/PF08022_12/1_5e03NAD_binding_6/PF08030_12/9_2NAD_binding_6/PF08030_12/5e08DUF2101/PF09874_9/6_1e02DUF2101/PF09874_9/4_3e02DUF2101/PF09874_9/2_3_NODE_1394_leng